MLAATRGVTDASVSPREAKAGLADAPSPNGARATRHARRLPSPHTEPIGPYGPLPQRGGAGGAVTQPPATRPGGAASRLRVPASPHPLMAFVCGGGWGGTGLPSTRPLIPVLSWPEGGLALLNIWLAVRCVGVVLGFTFV